jgi:hypothetical protein
MLRERKQECEIEKADGKNDKFDCRLIFINLTT